MSFKILQSNEIIINTVYIYHKKALTEYMPINAPLYFQWHRHCIYICIYILMLSHTLATYCSILSIVMQILLCFSLLSITCRWDGGWRGTPACIRFATGGASTLETWPCIRIATGGASTLGTCRPIWIQISW